MDFVVVYDACVLYPAPVRDLLMEIAISGLARAKWTERIHQEWMSSLVADRPDIESRIQQTKKLMDIAIPDALVTHYESLIEGITLPDARDRHVLAAAIKCDARMIITANLKDFPQEYLVPHGIEAIHPDQFIGQQFGLNQDTVIACAKRIRARLRNPEKNADEYLEILSSSRLPATADSLREYKELI